MLRRVAVLSAVLLFAVPMQASLSLAAEPAAAPVRPDLLQTPASGAAESIGAPANGCLRGAQELPPSGPGWDVTRPARHRAFGHPRLIDQIERISALLPPGQVLLIGDLSQPRGGRMPNGHASHQMGLDVDITFRPYAGGLPLPAALRENPPQPMMVDGKGQFLPAAWTPLQTMILRAFAEDPLTERIFVNPAIKQALCQHFAAAPPADRQWLHRVRPWWGHAAHLHVRLSCPPESPACTPGPEIPEGDGCGAELAEWLVPGGKPLPPSSAAPPPPPPAACLALWAEP